MSGHIDTEARDAWNRAREQGLKRGVRLVSMTADPIGNGRRHFRFGYEPIKPARAKRGDPPPSMTHDPDAVWDHVRASSRGLARDPRAPRQGELL